MLHAIQQLAKKDVLVTLGVVPDKPETGYGYLVVDKDGESIVHRVLQFVDKPTIVVAKKFIDSGNYLWNSGIFIFTAQTLFSEIENFTPELKEAVLLSFFVL